MQEKEKEEDLGLRPVSTQKISQPICVICEECKLLR
jgi:hypothetical protein